MPRRKKTAPMGRVDVQVLMIAATMVVLSCLCVYLFCYNVAYNDMIDSMEKRVDSIHVAVESVLRPESFEMINDPADMNTPLYMECHDQMFLAKQAAGVQYLYTAKRDENGTFVYGIDGLALDSPDFRRPGDLIEEEIIPELELALAGKAVMPAEIKVTYWGKIFIAYLPVRSNGEVVGVMGVEFEANNHYDAYRAMRRAAPAIIIFACIISALLAVSQFRRISNPTYKDLSNTDYLTQMKNRNAFETDMNNINAKKNHENLAIMMMDLNNLKKVNDSLGHEAGDLYLQSASQSIEETCEGRQAAYRVGGDEFVVVFPQATGEEMARIKTRLELALIARKPEGWNITPSFSTGYAIFDGDRDGDVHDTYRRADREMYTQKQRFHEGDGSYAGR